MSERSRYHRATIIAGLAVVSLWAGLAEARSHPEGRAGPRAELQGVVDVNEPRTPDREAPVCRDRVLEGICIEP